MIMTIKTTISFLVDLGVLLGSAAASDAFSRRRLPHGGVAVALVVAPARHLSETCAKVVHCVNRNTISGACPGSVLHGTCKDVSDGNCCTGFRACDGGTFD